MRPLLENALVDCRDMVVGRGVGGGEERLLSYN